MKENEKYMAREQVGHLLRVTGYGDPHGLLACAVVFGVAKVKFVSPSSEQLAKLIAYGSRISLGLAPKLQRCTDAGKLEIHKKLSRRIRLDDKCSCLHVFSRNGRYCDC